MRLTIIKSDNMVYVDGVSMQVNCASLPEDFHALQWKEDAGWIEFVDNSKPAEPVTDISEYQSFIDEWTLRDAEDKAEKTRLELLKKEIEERDALLKEQANNVITPNTAG